MPRHLEVDAMPDYGAPPQFGLSVTPESAHVDEITELVQLGDTWCLALIAYRDPADTHRFRDTGTMTPCRVGGKKHIPFFREVAVLPRRPRRCWPRPWRHSIG